MRFQGLAVLAFFSSSIGFGFFGKTELAQVEILKKQIFSKSSSKAECGLLKVNQCLQGLRTLDSIAADPWIWRPSVTFFVTEQSGNIDSLGNVYLAFDQTRESMRELLANQYLDIEELENKKGQLRLKGINVLCFPPVFGRCKAGLDKIAAASRVLDLSGLQVHVTDKMEDLDLRGFVSIDWSAQVLAISDHLAKQK
jgi:hypothetical protein